MLAYLSHQTIAAAKLPQVVQKIALSKVFVFVLASFLVCAREGSHVYWVGDPWISNLRAPEFFLPLFPGISTLVTDVLFFGFFENISSPLMTAPPAFKRFQEVGVSDASCLGGFRIHLPRRWFIGWPVLRCRVERRFRWDLRPSKTPPDFLFRWLRDIFSIKRRLGSVFPNLK